MNNPLVTVLISYYNDKDFLANAISHVLNQTYKNFELILINHATQDNCREIAHSFNDDRIIHIDLKKNMGCGGGFLMTEVLKVAKGKYYKLNCADDLMKENCLEKLVNYLEENEDKDVVFSDCEYIDKQGKSLNVFHSQKRLGYCFDYDEKKYLELYFKALSPLPIPASLIRIDKLREIEINDSLSLFFDMALWVELMIKGSKLGFIREPLVRYRIHDGQVSAIKKKNKYDKVGWFEKESFYEKFYDITDYEQLKVICRYSPYVKKITKDDKKFFKFIMMHYALMKKDCVSAYLQIEKMLSNPQEAKELEEKFDFTIKEFRNTYFGKTNLKNELKNANTKKIIKTFLKYPRYTIKYYIFKHLASNNYSL